MQNLLDIAKNIFSITYDKEDCRTVVKMFGIKLKMAGKELKDNKFQAFKDGGGKITEAPKADGPLRITQLANFQLLKEVDKYCRANNIKLWLTFGTLLGAVRHRGFIPWDDDIDVEMMREDYNKLIELLKSDSDKLDFYGEMIHKEKDYNIFLKIHHKKIPGLFMDIFPLDTLDKKLTKDERKKFSDKIKKYRHKMNKQISKYIKNKEEQELLAYIEEKRKAFFKQTSEQINKDNDLVWGIDFEHKRHKYLCFENSTYFPLREITFEGEKFYCVNEPKKFLEEVFGDYMSWPPKLYTHHFRFSSDKTLKDYYGENHYEELKKLLNLTDEEMAKI